MGSLAAALAVALPAEGPRAQDATAPSTEAETIQRALDERNRRADNLKKAQDALAASVGAKAQFEAEIASIGGDRAKLDAALLDAGRQSQATEDRMSRLEERLKTLSGSEAAIRRSLDARRGVIAEILAALQRMGRRRRRCAGQPGIRSGGDPDLDAARGDRSRDARRGGHLGRRPRRARAPARADRLRSAGPAERPRRLGARAAAARGPRRRAKARQVEVEAGLIAERYRAADLANQARSLKDLLERVEGEVASAKRTADEAKAAEQREAKATQERFAAAGIRDPAKLAPKVKFVDARGDAPRPVSGRLLRGFGQPDGNGGMTRGISLATRAKAVVSSPADGWVQFAGPFRSYGRTSGSSTPAMATISCWLGWIRSRSRSVSSCSGRASRSVTWAREVRSSR